MTSTPPRSVPGITLSDFSVFGSSDQGSPGFRFNRRPVRQFKSPLNVYPVMSGRRYRIFRIRRRRSPGVLYRQF